MVTLELLQALCPKTKNSILETYIGLTKRINGGTNGLEDRQHHYDIALKWLQE